MITDADVLAAVAAHESDARAAMEFVHGHPELGHSEFECSEFLADQLAAKGLEIQRGVGGMDTAFTATVKARSRDAPSGSSACTTPSRRSAPMARSSPCTPAATA